MAAARAMNAPEIARPPSLPRLLAGVSSAEAPSTLAEHVAIYGQLPPAGAIDLQALVEASGLQGRGGAGFPTATKLRAVAAQRGQPLVVANGTEGEPISGKDKVLVRHFPHLVLDGAAVAAQALGACEAIVAVSRADGEGLDALSAAIAERGGKLDKRVRLRTVAVPDGFVAGEETALVQFLNRGVAKPTFTPPRPFERGVGKAPTLVQNVETLAQLALIARFGPAWFRALGTVDEPGSALVTISGAVAEPGVYEVALGTPLRELVALAGGVTEHVRAFLVGGFFGSWLGERDAAQASLLEADLRPRGARLGARALVVLPASACGICETARTLTYLARLQRRSVRPLRAWPRRDRALVRTACGAARPGRAATDATLDPAGPRPRSMPASRRRHGVRNQRARGVRARGRAASSRPLRGRTSDAANTCRYMRKRVRVNPIACEGHGLCAELLPERIQLDEWGFPIVDPEPVTGEAARHAARAVEACPTLALLLEKDA